MDDEELHQRDAARGLQRGEDRRKGRLPIDQQLHMIAGQAMQPCQPWQRAQPRVIGLPDNAGLALLRLHAVAQFAHLLAIEAPRIDIADEIAAAEHQVRHQRQIRYQQQRAGPGNGARRGPDRHHGMHRGKHADQVETQDNRRDNAGAR